MSHSLISKRRRLDFSVWDTAGDMCLVHCIHYFVLSFNTYANQWALLPVQVKKTKTEQSKLSKVTDLRYDKPRTLVKCVDSKACAPNHV